MNEPQKHAIRKKLDTKSHMLHDFFYGKADGDSCHGQGEDENREQLHKGVGFPSVVGLLLTDCTIS
jgi:hypothetical protein